MVLLDIGDILIHIGKWGSLIGFILAFVVFGIWNLIKFPKMIVKGVAAVVGLIIIIVIAYIFASGDTTIAGKDYSIAPNFLTDGGSKAISTVLLAVTIMTVLGFGLMLIDIVKGFIVNN